MAALFRDCIHGIRRILQAIWAWIRGRPQRGPRTTASRRVEIPLQDTQSPFEYTPMVQEYSVKRYGTDEGLIFVGRPSRPTVFNFPLVDLTPIVKEGLASMQSGVGSDSQEGEMVTARSRPGSSTSDAISIISSQYSNRELAPVEEQDQD